MFHFTDRDEKDIIILFYNQIVSRWFAMITASGEKHTNAAGGVLYLGSLGSGVIVTNRIKNHRFPIPSVRWIHGSPRMWRFSKSTEYTPGVFEAVVVVLLINLTLFLKQNWLKLETVPVSKIWLIDWLI